MSRLIAVAFSAATLAATGCVGVYNNRPMFITEPPPGMGEAELISRYGTPAFSGFALDQKIYTYKVRDNKFIILLGIYEGYDLVVICEGGEVRDTRRVPRPRTVAILHPTPWAEGLD